MHITLVYNSKSGSALSKDELQKKFDKADIKIDKFVVIEKGFEKQLVEVVESAGIVAAIGGDGTISAVAGLLANTKATLAPLPGGTLNHFTKDLGIPQDIDEAILRLKKLRPKQIDIASVGEQFYINNSSIGLYPSSLHDRKDIQPKVGKWPAAVLASLRSLFRFKTYSVIIEKKEYDTPFVFVGNNRYAIDSFGGANRDKLNEGLLSVYITKTKSRLKLIKIFVLALFGAINNLPELDEFYVKSLDIHIKRKKSLSVSYDGEVSRLEVPLNYKIHRKALWVLG